MKLKFKIHNSQIKKNKKELGLKTSGLDWEEAKEITQDIKKLVKILDLNYVDPESIYCYRTKGSKSRSYARIWSFPKIFQHALKIKPAYVIEVLSKHYDKLNDEEKKLVLIHELLHIPKNFSGALVPHLTRSRRLETEAKKLFKLYKELTK